VAERTLTAELWVYVHRVVVKNINLKPFCINVFTYCCPRNVHTLAVASSGSALTSVASSRSSLASMASSVASLAASDLVDVG
jgi:hypothetical protein